MNIRQKEGSVFKFTQGALKRNGWNGLREQICACTLGPFRQILEAAVEFAISRREKTACATFKADDSYRSFMYGRIVMSHFWIFVAVDRVASPGLRSAWDICSPSISIQGKAPDMQIPHDATLLRIFIGESDRWHHQPLYEAIVLKAREMHLAGATVLRGPMGFGKSSRLHTAKILRLSTDLPLVIEIVDAEEKIVAFLPVLDEMLKGGLVTMEKARVVEYRADAEDSAGQI